MGNGASVDDVPPVAAEPGPGAEAAVDHAEPADTLKSAAAQSEDSPEPAAEATVDHAPVTCLDAALQWAGRGCSVFPVPPGTKKSYKAGKQNGGARWGATKDLVEIERDWQRWPNANVGLPTDAVNGFFVVKADTREGHPKLGDQDGLDSLAALEREFRPLPATLMAESPTGSQHRYFGHPVGAPVRSKEGWRHGVNSLRPRCRTICYQGRSTNLPASKAG
jgi:hypothetical protein